MLIGRSSSKPNCLIWLSKCSRVGNQFADQLGSQPDDKALSFTSHYNPNDNKCYVEGSGVREFVIPVQVRTVWDAQEKREVAECVDSGNNLACFLDKDRKETPARVKAVMDRAMGTVESWPAVGR
jgi:hypothetical protein